MSSAIMKIGGAVRNLLTPPKKSAEATYGDCVEWWCHQIVYEDDPIQMKEFENQLYDTLQKWRSKPTIPRSGRLGNRISLASLMLLIGKPIQTHDDDDIMESQDDQEASLMEFDSVRWQTLMEEMKRACHYLLRTDASYNVGMDSKIDRTLAEEDIFRSEVDDIMQLLQLHKMLAHMRQEMDDSDDDETNMDTYWNRYKEELETLYQGTPVPRALLNLDKKRLGQQVETRLLLNEHSPFSLQTLQRRFRRLVRAWYDRILGEPTLVTKGISKTDVEALTSQLQERFPTTTSPQDETGHAVEPKPASETEATGRDESQEDVLEQPNSQESETWLTQPQQRYSDTEEDSRNARRGKPVAVEEHSVSQKQPGANPKATPKPTSKTKARKRDQPQEHGLEQQDYQESETWLTQPHQHDAEKESGEASIGEPAAATEHTGSPAQHGVSGERQDTGGTQDSQESKESVALLTPNDFSPAATSQTEKGDDEGSEPSVEPQHKEKEAPPSEDEDPERTQQSEAFLTQYPLKDSNSPEDPEDGSDDALLTQKIASSPAQAVPESQDEEEEKAEKRSELAQKTRKKKAQAKPPARTHSRGPESGKAKKNKRLVAPASQEIAGPEQKESIDPPGQSVEEKKEHVDSPSNLESGQQPQNRTSPRRLPPGAPATPNTEKRVARSQSSASSTEKETPAKSKRGDTSTRRRVLPPRAARKASPAKHCRKTLPRAAKEHSPAATSTADKKEKGRSDEEESISTSPDSPARNRRKTLPRAAKEHSPAATSRADEKNGTSDEEASIATSPDSPVSEDGESDAENIERKEDTGGTGEDTKASSVASSQPSHSDEESDAESSSSGEGAQKKSPRKRKLDSSYDDTGSDTGEESEEDIDDDVVIDDLLVQLENKAKKQRGGLTRAWKEFAGHEEGSVTFGEPDLKRRRNLNPVGWNESDDEREEEEFRRWTKCHRFRLVHEKVIPPSTPQRQPLRVVNITSPRLANPAPERPRLTRIRDGNEIAGARKRKAWTNEEVRALEEGIEKFGPGNWAGILDAYWEVFRQNGRTNVDLKDKYRNVEKKGYYW